MGVGRLLDSYLHFFPPWSFSASFVGRWQGGPQLQKREFSEWYKITIDAAILTSCETNLANISEYRWINEKLPVRTTPNQFLDAHLPFIEYGKQQSSLVTDHEPRNDSQSFQEMKAMDHIFWNLATKARIDPCIYCNQAVDGSTTHLLNICASEFESFPQLLNVKICNKDLSSTTIGPANKHW